MKLRVHSIAHKGKKDIKVGRVVKYVIRDKEGKAKKGHYRYRVEGKAADGLAVSATISKEKALELQKKLKQEKIPTLQSKKAAKKPAKKKSCTARGKTAEAACHKKRGTKKQKRPRKK